MSTPEKADEEPQRWRNPVDANASEINVPAAEAPNEHHFTHIFVQAALCTPSVTEALPVDCLPFASKGLLELFDQMVSPVACWQPGDSSLQHTLAYWLRFSRDDEVSPLQRIANLFRSYAAYVAPHSPTVPSDPARQAVFERLLGWRGISASDLVKGPDIERFLLTGPFPADIQDRFWLDLAASEDRELMTLLCVDVATLVNAIVEDAINRSLMAAPAGRFARIDVLHNTQNRVIDNISLAASLQAELGQQGGICLLRDCRSRVVRNDIAEGGHRTTIGIQGLKKVDIHNTVQSVLARVHTTHGRLPHNRIGGVRIKMSGEQSPL